MHSKAYRFLVIEPNGSVNVNTIIESLDAVFYENQFTTIPRSDSNPETKSIPLVSKEESEPDEPNRPIEPRRSKMARTEKSFG